MRGRGLLLALACLVLVAVGTAHGQFRRRPDTNSNPSHILLPGGIGDRDAAETLLAQRLRRSRDLSAVQDLLKKIGAKPEDFINEDLLKDPMVQEMAKKFRQNPASIPIDPNDKNLKELVRQALEKQDKIKLDKEDRESIHRILGDLKPPEPRPPDGPGPMPPGVEPPPMGGMPPMPGGSPMPMPGGSEPPSNPEDPSPPPDEKLPAEPSPSSPRSQRANLLGGWLEPLRGGGGITGELRNTLRGLLGSRTGLGSYTRDLTSDLGARFGPRLSDLPLGKIARGFGGSFPDALRLRPGDTERRGGVALPDFSRGGAGDLGRGALWLVVLAGLGVLLWVLLVRPRWARLGGRDGWRLGPWPVKPSGVRTRGDVVKAFEYLALLLLGRQISTSHHLDIAGQLGKSPDDPTGRRNNAAQELALLYEHARYAPPDEQLSEDELAAARRDLGFLAGGAAA